MVITLVGETEGFVNERVGGTLRRLLTTPTGEVIILSGKTRGWLGMGISGGYLIPALLA